MLRQTIIVHDRNAWRTHRTQAAIDAQQGLQLCTMEQLAARLAGGFLQPIDDDALNLALAAALVTPLGDLDAIKALPGFQRAAAATLGQAWTAGLDLTAEMAAASTGTAAARLGSLATLEREVLKHLPANQLRPRNLVAAALEHVRHSRALFGRIAIRGHTALVHESNPTQNDPDPGDFHRPMAYESGLPRSVIRFKMWHAMSTSACCPPGARARRRSPMIDLYRKTAFSTRACR